MRLTSLGKSPASAREDFRDGRRPVTLIDGALSIVEDDGSITPLRMHGATLPEKSVGWLPDCVYPGASGLRTVQWRANDGGRAVHFYTPGLEFVADSFAHLGTGPRGALVDLSVRPLRRLWSDLVCHPVPRPVPLPPEYVSLGPIARQDIAGHLWPILHRPAVGVVLNETPREQWPGVPIPFEMMERIFARDFLAMQIDAIKTGALRMTDDATVSCSSGIFLRADGFTPIHAYRFLVSVHSEVFYLVCANWSYAPKCLYFPRRELVVYPDAARRSYLDWALGLPVDKAMFQAVARHADLLNEYIPEGNHQLACCYFYQHIGHHLWNELTGLDNTLAATPAAVYAVGGQSSEMYGRLDTLFPDCADSIDRSVDSLAELPEVLYERRVGFMHPTGEKITEGLRHRILSCAEESASVVAAREQHADLGQQGFQFVLIGLRTENRTLVDLFGFCRDVVTFLAGEMGKLAVIIDGHNVPSPGARPFRGIGNATGELRPDDAEYEVLNQLRDAFRDDPMVRIVSALGEPVAFSLWWASRAAFFVTPWGAGLAKYRWICNLPGVIVSNRFFLSSQESYLYDDERYLDNPAVTFRIARDDATDAPDADRVIGIPERARYNFHVDMRAVERELRSVVRFVSVSANAADALES